MEYQVGYIQAQQPDDPYFDTLFEAVKYADNLRQSAGKIIAIWQVKYRNEFYGDEIQMVKIRDSGWFERCRRTPPPLEEVIIGGRR